MIAVNDCDWTRFTAHLKKWVAKVGSSSVINITIFQTDVMSNEAKRHIRNKYRHILNCILIRAVHHNIWVSVKIRGDMLSHDFNNASRQ